MSDAITPTEPSNNEPSTTSTTNSGNETESKFYTISKNYWETQPATVNGMLGGYDYVSNPDVEQSQLFLDLFFSTRPTNKHRIEKHLALDCGAGIGRVSKHLLLKNFDFVEMVDANKNFIDQATDYLGEEMAKRVLKFHNSGLESFYPEPNKYDCIWIQWVLGYLTDNDLVDFFKRCKLALKPTGVIILKENIAQNQNEFDELDSSWTRTKQSYINLIHKAGLHLIKDEKQRKFPSELYEVRLFAFK